MPHNQRPLTPEKYVIIGPSGPLRYTTRIAGTLTAEALFLRGAGRDAQMGKKAAKPNHSPWDNYLLMRDIKI